MLTAYLGDEVLPPVRVTEEVIAAGQRRGEVRADEPAEALGVIVLYAVLFSTQRGATIGRREGSSPPGRPRLPGRNTLLPQINMPRLAFPLRLRRPGAGGMHPVINATTAPWADVAAT